jgi:outer membrane protein TolC
MMLVTTSLSDTIPQFDKTSAGPIANQVFSVKIADDQNKNSYARSPADSSAVLTLDMAITAALENNPHLKAAGYSVNETKALTNKIRSSLFPTLSGVADYSRYLNDQRLIQARYNGEPGVFGKDIFSGDIILRMPLFTGRRLINELRAAELLGLAAEKRLSRSTDELVFNISSVFYSLLAGEKLIEALQFSTRTLENHLQRIDDMITGRKAAPVDMMRIEVRLADLKQRLIRQENDQRIRYQLLLNMIGKDGGALQPRISGNLESYVFQEQPPEQMVSTALLARPDFLAMKDDVAALKRRVAAAKSGYVPTVNLAASWGGRWAPGGTGADTSGLTIDAGRIGVGAEVMLFDAGKRRATVAEAKARLATAQQTLRARSLQIGLEVQTAWANITSARERLETARKSINQAEESLRIEQEKYALGKGTVTDVLDAQTALLETETAYHQALADACIAGAQLKFAVGKDSIQ